MCSKGFRLKWRTGVMALRWLLCLYDEGPMPSHTWSLRWGGIERMGWGTGEQNHLFSICQLHHATSDLCMKKILNCFSCVQFQYVSTDVCWTIENGPIHHFIKSRSWKWPWKRTQQLKLRSSYLRSETLQLANLSLGIVVVADMRTLLTFLWCPAYPCMKPLTIYQVMIWWYMFELCSQASWIAKEKNLGSPT